MHKTNQIMHKINLTFIRSFNGVLRWRPFANQISRVSRSFGERDQIWHDLQRNSGHTTFICGFTFGKKQTAFLRGRNSSNVFADFRAKNFYKRNLKMRFWLWPDAIWFTFFTYVQLVRNIKNQLQQKISVLKILVRSKRRIFFQNGGGRILQE